MTKYSLNTLKGALLFSTLLFFCSSCENDLESVQPGFITDNKNFVTEDYSFDNDPVLTTVPVDKVASNGLLEYLLGVKIEATFGELKAAIATQVLLDGNGFSTTFPSFDVADTTFVKVERKLDGAFLVLPYYSTLDSDSETRAYELDSIFGDTAGTLDFKVSQLGEYLSLLDPDSPSKSNSYYSDHDFEAIPFERTLGTASVTPNAVDTVYYFNRNTAGVVMKDSIILTNASPFITIPLSEDIAYFEDAFLEKFPKDSLQSLSDTFKANADFTRFFKGIYIEPTGATKTMLSLPIASGFISFNYTEYITGRVGGVDGVALDTIYKQETLSMSGGIAVSNYTHNHDLEDDQTNKLYVQGAGGYEVSIDLFGDAGASTTIEKMRDEANNSNGNLQWLVNEAVLEVFVDEENIPELNDSNIYVYKNTDIAFPTRLFLYRNKEGSLLQIEDYFNSSFSSIQGLLSREENVNDAGEGLETYTYSYKFYLTDYIKELIDVDSTENMDQLMLKVYVSGDTPTTIGDVNVDTRNWQHKGVVLAADKTDLRINYSK
jgi:hypothetical protein